MSRLSSDASAVDEVIERLKAEVSVQRLAEARGVELKRHGADLIGCCPFHEDRTPSLVITPAKNLWNCLGACQAGGTVIDWAMRAEGISFRHAVGENFVFGLQLLPTTQQVRLTEDMVNPTLSMELKSLDGQSVLQVSAPLRQWTWSIPSSGQSALIYARGTPGTFFVSMPGASYSYLYPSSSPIVRRKSSELGF